MKFPFWKRWFRGSTTPQQESPNGRGVGKKAARFVRPLLEALEDRILPSGLPQDLVVGRTLSAYFVGGIQNHQETITYTIYNEQADPITGVLLTDTLQPGVTLQN